jgi:hypothetical protein
MTETQKKLARHALGLPNKQNTSYRNRFFTDPGCTDYAEWQAMVAEGNAIERTGSLWSGDRTRNMFCLTLKGALAVRGPKEHISREDAEEMRMLESA